MNGDKNSGNLTLLKELEARLGKRILGQELAKGQLVGIVKHGELGLRPPNRPKGVMFLVGPTGVGKTESITVISELVFGRTLKRFDMSEYQGPGALDRFLERLCAYRDQYEGGFLLFDEIEKAHPDVLDLFLQITDAARVTGLDNVLRDFSGYYMAFTSNIAGRAVMRLVHSSTATLHRFVVNELTSFLRPEFVGRFGKNILIFGKLTDDQQRGIAQLIVEKELERLAASHGVQVEVTEEAFEWIVLNGIDKGLGARPMRDTVEKGLAHAVSECLLNGVPPVGLLKVSPSHEFLVIEAKALAAA